MTPYVRALSGVSVGISISESEGSGQLGFGSQEVNQVTVEFSRELMGQGASVVFGHDWRPDGVMHAVATAAASAQPLGDLAPPTESPQPNAPSKPRSRPRQLLRNYLPWPTKTVLSREEREQLSASLYIETLPLPAELKDYESITQSGPPVYPYLVARALTALRHRLVAETDARVCIGGKAEKYAGRYPGVIEEALFTLEARKPLFLIGAFGGATQRMIEVVEGAPPKSFANDGAMRELYQKHQLETDQDTWSDRDVDANEVWPAFQALGIEGLGDLNRLSPEENRELFTTSAIPTAIEIVLTGLGRLRRDGNIGQ